MKLDEMFFMAEAQGDFPTRPGKINAVIRDIKNYPAPTIGMYEFEKILNKHGLTFKMLTDREIQKINAEIR